MTKNLSFVLYTSQSKSFNIFNHFQSKPNFSRQNQYLREYNYDNNLDVYSTSFHATDLSKGYTSSHQNLFLF